MGLQQTPGSQPVCVGRQSPAAGGRRRPVTGRQRPQSRAPVAPWRPQVSVTVAPTPCTEDTEAQRDSGQAAPTCGPGAARAGVSKQRQSFVKPPVGQLGATPVLTQHLALTPGPSSLLGPGSGCPRGTAGQRLSSCQTRKGTSPAPCSHPGCGHCEHQLKARGGSLLCEPADKPDMDSKNAVTTQQDKGQDRARGGHTQSRP